MNRHAPRGRPPAADETAIQLMFALRQIAIERGEAPPSDRALARQVISLLRLNGASGEALEDRLRKKFRAAADRDFRPNKPRAGEENRVHLRPHDGGGDAVYLGLLRDGEVSEVEGRVADADSGCDAMPSAQSGDQRIESRASVRIVDRRRHARQQGGPRYMLTIRLKVTRVETIEFRLRAGAARELAAAIDSGLSELDRLYEVENVRGADLDGE